MGQRSALIIDDEPDVTTYLSAILTDGIAHPTGYPTYLLVGKLFQSLPFGTPYFRGSLLSAVSSAVTVGLVAFIIIDPEEMFPVIHAVSPAYQITGINHK